MTDIVERLGNLNDSMLMCGNDYSDVLLDAANELKSLRQLLEASDILTKLWGQSVTDIVGDLRRMAEEQLAECQAREKVLLEALKDYRHAIRSHNSNAMLNQAKREAMK